MVARSRSESRELTGPIIVTALFERDFPWLNDLRRAHFPPERNILAAHLTLFHHLPPSGLDEVVRLLKIETRDAPPPAARLSGMMSLGNGVAFRVDSPGLYAIRQRIADAFSGQLIPQDQAGWRPHITIQNKVDASTARALMATLSDSVPRPLTISGLAAHFYRGGPWEAITACRFSRSDRSRRN